jgi:hypothetical protein
MDKFLRRFFPSMGDHLSDDRMASLFCHELPFVERLIARQHLAMCWHCRVRREDLEGRRADRMVDLYRDAVDRGGLSLPDEPRAEFVQRLGVHIQNVAPRRWWAWRLPDISLPEFPPMNLMLATSMVLGLAAAISFFFWRQQRLPNISSNALLVRAERWDTSDLTAPAGVVYQAVRITTTKQASKQTTARSIYRDLRGERKPMPVKLDAREEQLRNRLTQAGMDWDEPLSASGYQGWHDRQHVREDKIVRAGTHLLRLTTTVPNGDVAEQSLTVRDTDFHPVRRTVAFRDSGTVEIAEVDFKILPWTAVDASVFEPVGGGLHTVATATPRVLPFPRMPEMLTDEQLDETELGARLVLNRLHADTGEQVEINRLPQGVEIKGLVDTDERKQALQTQLRAVPHLMVSIQSVAELKNGIGGNDDTSSIKTASMPDQPSPLETYLVSRGRGVSDINILAQRLFNDALEISQESKAIGDLKTHFVPGDQKTIVASATLSELIYSHHQRLQAALKQERELLAEASTAPGIEEEASTSASGASSLMDAAARNLALCKELTQTNSPATRSAEKILAEMSVSVGDLTADVHEAYGMTQGDSTLSGKK